MRKTYIDTSYIRTKVRGSDKYSMNKITYQSVEDHLNGLKEFNIHATQLHPGNFVCHQRELQLPKLIIGDRFINTALLYDSILQQDFFYILIPREHKGISINGKKTPLHQSIIFIKNQEMLVRVPDGFYAFYIIITTDELNNYFGENNIELLKKVIWQQNLVQNTFHQPEYIQLHLCSLIEKLLNQNKYLSYQNVLNTQEAIIESLYELLIIGTSLTTTKIINTPSKLVIVNRAIKHIHKSNVLAITSPELAKASCCCIRNLEYAFKSILDISPKQYLIKRRLQLINTALKIESNLSITDIMNNFGIINQGRFAQDYFKFYGEYPHQTRNKRSHMLRSNIEESTTLDSTCM